MGFVSFEDATKVNVESVTIFIIYVEINQDGGRVTVSVFLLVSLFCKIEI
jgi:hypothetical protein